ncbi:V-type proton ATPase subunit E-like [Schistocerca gregaria]|uniref:V-type proton ATPase subunit E-like n=1 Tax=Schistocerca gregaria TaxID=7010 RepID=UPI00211E45B4|nr:V-type proton ATPase subunit E-like [Schistocerca gregaria]
MNAAAVEAQLEKMKKFIEKEAQEKVLEIREKSEEEFTILKAKLVQTEKLKILSEFERREKSLQLKQKINYSTAFNKARLERLSFQQKKIQAIFSEARSKLEDVVQQESYKDLLVKLTVQGLFLMDEKVVVLRVREQDIELLNSLLPTILEKYEKWRPNCGDVRLEVSSEKPAKCVGGVILSTPEGHISCNNTLEMRLIHAFDISLPLLRRILYSDITV